MPPYPPYPYPPPHAPPYPPEYPPGDGIPVAAPPPRVLVWNEGEMIPPGYHKGTQIRIGLVASGAVLFGTAWLPSLIAGSFFINEGPHCGSTTVYDAATNSYIAQQPSSCPPSPAYMMIPVVGPWIVAGGGGSDVKGPPAFWLAFDGIQQSAGLAMFIAGFVAPRTVLLRADVKSATIVPTPMSFGPGSLGFGIRGLF